MKNYKQNETKQKVYWKNNIVLSAHSVRIHFECSQLFVLGSFQMCNFFLFIAFGVVSRVTIYENEKQMQMMFENPFTSVYAWHIASYND